jgi:hypothetical protein
MAPACGNAYGIGRNPDGDRQTTASDGHGLSQLELHLGYEDDDYSDSGYYAHDDGTEHQCKETNKQDGGSAHVTITIYLRCGARWPRQPL